MIYLFLHFLRNFLRISPYSVRILEYTDQSNSGYGHFSRSAILECIMSAVSYTVTYVQNHCLLETEAVSQRCSIKNVFVRPATLLKKILQHICFPSESCKIFKNTLFSQSTSSGCFCRSWLQGLACFHQVQFTGSDLNIYLI